jgi:hypothetical protein
VQCLQEEKEGPDWRLLLVVRGRRGPMVVEMGYEGPGCGLFASWRRGPWIRIMCKLEKRALDADYSQVGKEGPGCGLFASWRRGP